MAKYLKGNYFGSYTHFSLNHDYERKGKKDEKSLHENGGPTDFALLCVFFWDV